MGDTATGLTRERVDGLREALGLKFAGDPTKRRAILSILEPLSEGWSNHEQGMMGDSFDAVDAALGSPLEALAAVPVDQAGMACDQLAQAWEKVRGKIVWVE